MSEELEDILAHYGIKGMQWGVRRDRTRTRYEKPPAKLTEAELQRRIKRMETEKKYNELNRRDVSPGEAFATKLLNNIGFQALSTIGVAAAVLLGKKVIEKKFGPKLLSEMFPKKR